MRPGLGSAELRDIDIADKIQDSAIWNRYSLNLVGDCHTEGGRCCELEPKPFIELICLSICS